MQSSVVSTRSARNNFMLHRKENQFSLQPPEWQQN
uniref:Uncharacterized protein n=1 Tax=Rhizophora mucronata TaxID=61149 RepID=A0A2P2NGH6_RHIMU